MGPTRSGESPSPLSWRTLFCVGFVFCSPVALGWRERGREREREGDPPQKVRVTNPTPIHRKY